MHACTLSETVKILIENGARIDLQWSTRAFSSDESQSGRIFEVAKVLLENGAQVDQQTGSGASALISASEKGHSKVVRLLLEYSAQVMTGTFYLLAPTLKNP